MSPISLRIGIVNAGTLVARTVTPLTCSAWAGKSSAILRDSSLSSESPFLRSASSSPINNSTLSGTSSSELATSLAICCKAADRDSITDSAFLPVMASIRCSPVPTLLSPVIRNMPSCPVDSTWVPPHSSLLIAGSPIVNTRTFSPYFSSNRAIAPVATASA